MPEMNRWPGSSRSGELRRFGDSVYVSVEYIEPVAPSSSDCSLLVCYRASSLKRLTWLPQGFFGLHTLKLQRKGNRRNAIASLSMPCAAAARATVGSIGGPAAAEQIRSPCAQPGFAEQLKITGPLADGVAGASPPPAASGGGRAHRALS